MDILDAGRDLAEELMVDACELRAPDVQGSLNETTNTYTPTPGALRYSGACKVQTTDTIGQDRAAGERLTTTTRFEVHLPMSAAAAQVDDVITITASQSDPQLVGRRFRVASLVHKTWMTARRTAVEEVQA
jgi:hypothetical protein